MPERASRRLWLAYLLLAILFGISVIHRIRDTADRIDEMRNGTAIARLPFSVDLPGFAIIDPRPEAEAAGIKTGDAIVAIDGQPLRDGGDLFVPLRERRAGEQLVLRIRSTPDSAAKTDSQGSIVLGAGDVLVAFTDGISEAMNSRDEEWGEERLAAAIVPVRAMQAKRLIERIMEEADTFVAGARQYDDMTVVVVRLLIGTES